MASHTRQILPPFDFSTALTLSLTDRFRICLERAQEIVAGNGYGDYMDARCIPSTGGDESQLQQMESSLGIPLPGEYRQFLTRCRYLKIDDGIEVGGLDHDGLYVTEIPWVSDEHRAGVNYLVFANYWRYADGDQLMIDLTEPDLPVIAYLHEHGPLFEFYAPSFSLALWRLVHEN